MKKMRSLVFLLAAFILVPAWMMAQTGQVGSIKGIVTTNDGIALPGVAVTLKSPALVIGKMTAVTSLNGNYRFASLPPGNYELSFEMEGMDTFIHRGIVINANINVNIDATMQFKTLQEQVVVEGKAPTIDVKTVSKTTTLDLTLLNSLPSQRNLNSYVNMTPGMTMTANGAYTSSQGAGVRDNQYNLDGVQMNDPAIGTNSSLAFSMDIMDEVSVQTGGLSAEYGSVKGAAVSVVSKSGGNNFSGTLSGYYNSLDLMSDNTTGTDLEGSLSGPKYEYEPGLAIGGPLAKDKLWFFLNLSTKRNAHYFPGFPYDKPKNSVPIHDNNLLPFIKLTFQPNQNNKLVASFNYNKRDIDNDWLDKYQNEDTVVTYKNPSIVGNLQWTGNFGSNLMTNVKFGYVDVDKNWYAHKQVEYYWNYDTELASGGYSYDDLNTRRRMQFDVDGTYFIDNFHGSHELKFGVQTAYGTSRLNRPMYGPKDEKGFTRAWNYIWDGELYYAEWYNGYDQKGALLNAGVFLNDVWNIGKHLTLNIGVRFDHSRNILPKQGDPSDPLARGDFGYIGHPEVQWDMVVPETKTLFSWSNFSPRVGFVYDLFADGKTLLKANFSHYIQDNFTAIGFELNPVNWTGYGMYVTPEGVPYWLDYTSTTGMTTEVGYKDHKLKTPYTNELTVGIERELFSDFSLGLTFIRKFDRDLIEDVDGSALDMDKLMNEGVLDWTAYEKVNVVDPYDGKTITFWDQKYYFNSKKYIVNPPGADRDYTSVEVIFKKRYSKGYSFNASYVFAKSTGLIGQEYWDSEGRQAYYNNPNKHENASGRLPLERRHQFKLEAMVKGPLGIDLSTSFRYLSGFPHARWVNSKELGRTDFYTTQITRAEQCGSYEYPDMVLFDVRVAKNFRLSKQFGLMLFADIFNVLNENNATDLYDYSSSQYTKFRQMELIEDPRIFRLGFKLSFN